MAQPDGRLEQGQSIKKALSASKWNDLCDAADVVLGRNGGIQADPGRAIRLPCQVGKFDGGASGVEFGKSYHVTWSASVETDSTIPTKALPGLTPVPVEAEYQPGQSGKKIVIGHPSAKHAAVYSGFAAALVQVTSYTHKYARAPIGGTGTSFSSGILQSAHFGPIEIVDYFTLTSSTTTGLTISPDPSTSLIWPNFELVWALVWI